MRSIDADGLRKCAIPCVIHNGALTELCVPLYQIDNAPTVEERHHNEWNIHGLCFECPICHCGCMFTIVDKIVYGHLNFCPNCGADMRGDNNK